MGRGTQEDCGCCATRDQVEVVVVVVVERRGIKPSTYPGSTEPILVLKVPGGDFTPSTKYPSCGQIPSVSHPRLAASV